MASDFVANSCGGVRWRTNSGGLIELEGLGVPMLDPSDPAFKNLAQTWTNFGSELGSAADQFGIPRAWTLAFATMETGFLSASKAAQAAAQSPAGALGVMQLMPQYFTQYSQAQLLDPSINIPAGVHFIQQLASRASCPGYGELPYLGSIYNAGSGAGCVQCDVGKNAFNFVEDSDYSMWLVKYNNTALTYLKLGESFLLWMMGGIFVTGAAAAAYFGLPRR